MRIICLLLVNLILVVRSPIAQAQENHSRYYLPDINVGIEFMLEHVFKSHQRQDNRPDNNTNTDINESMLLIGILINGVNRIAWIKTQEFQVHELSLGQRVPGSTLRIDRVYADSVELVDDDACQHDVVCDPQLVLELN